MKVVESKSPEYQSFFIEKEEFIFQTNFNHLHHNKKFYTVTHKCTGKYLGSVLNKTHAKSVAKAFLSGDEPLSLTQTVDFLKGTYGHCANFEEAMSGSTYMRIGSKTVRISDHDTKGTRALPDLDLSAGECRKNIIKLVDSLLK